MTSDYQHGCENPAECKRRGPVDCAIRGNLNLILPLNPVSVRRRFQRELDRATTPAQVAEIVAAAQFDLHMRRIEIDAREERREQLRTDPARYRREFRLMQDMLREMNRAARLRSQVAVGVQR